MYRPNKSKYLLAVLLLGTAPCFAEHADRDKLIHLEADQVLMDDVQQISTFSGNVQLSQGTLLIRGDKIVVMQDKEGFKHAVAYGKPAEFRQKREGLDEYVEGYAERIEYDTRTETLNFHERARLKRDLDEVSGENITYSTKTEIFQVNSGASSGDILKQRVRAVLQPKSKDSGNTQTTTGTPPGTPGKSITPVK